SQRVGQPLQRCRRGGQFFLAVKGVGQALAVGQRAGGVGTVLVKQPAVPACQHLVVLHLAKQQIGCVGVQLHQLVAEGGVVGDETVQVVKQLSRRALQHLGQAGEQIGRASGRERGGSSGPCRE